METQSSEPADRRVFFRDIKPYEGPGVAGPAARARKRGGRAVALGVLGAGGGRIDLDEPGGIGLAYRAVLAEGTADDQIAVLSRERLLAVWPDLMLPARVRTLWEDKFPELRRTAAA